jgi:protein O-GlcNAc transferase
MSASQINGLLQAAQGFKQKGQLNRAITCYQEALALDATALPIWYNLANTHKQTGQFAEALEAYQRALSLNPDSPEVNFNLANTLTELNEKAAAYPHYLKVIQAWPQFAPAYSLLGDALEAMDQPHQAVKAHRHAISLAPNDPSPHMHFAAFASNLTYQEEAEASYRRALELRPNSADLLSKLGATQLQQGKLREALDYQNRALAIDPQSPYIMLALAAVSWDLGDIAAAIELHHRAHAVQPDLQPERFNLLFAVAYSGSLTGVDYLACARRLMQDLTASARSKVLARDALLRAPRAGRALRVAYISGDLREHAVSYFLDQLFAAHDHRRADVWVYNNSPLTDAYTDKLRSQVAHWCNTKLMSDDKLAAQIRADEIDVLIDLSGHTGHHRLSVFAQRVAPVQAHYLGFFASTGLDQMDYWIGDEVLTPPEAQSHFSENLWRLPRTWVSYQGREDAPEPDSPNEPDGTVWLGTFNNLVKITDATLLLWARVLQAVPQAKLLLKAKGLGEPLNRERIERLLHGQGIAPSRIELLSATGSWTEHMALYNRLDIALDPIGGVGGGTTTCDALWMGLPVVTLQGDFMAQRMTASMVDALGHPEWIANDEDAYVATVVSLAAQTAHRHSLRRMQRDKMRRSPLCDTVGLAHALEDAYEAMFDQWANARVNAAGSTH